MADGYSKSHIEKVLWDVYGLYLIDEQAIRRTATGVSIHIV